MSILLYLTLTTLFSYLFSLSPLTPFTLQFLALFALILVFSLKNRSTTILLASTIINLLVFTTHGLDSPLFFLTYFLLFLLGFQFNPTITLAYSLVLIIFLTQSLTSPSSLLTLFSLLLVSPLAFFISKLHLDNLRLGGYLSLEETNTLLWLNLKFKTGILKIIDETSQLLEQPSLSSTNREKLHFIKDSAKNLLNSSKTVVKDLDSDL